MNNIMPKGYSCVHRKMEKEMISYKTQLARVGETLKEVEIPLYKAVKPGEEPFLTTEKDYWIKKGYTLIRERSERVCA